MYEHDNSSDEQHKLCFEPLSSFDSIMMLRWDTESICFLIYIKCLCLRGEIKIVRRWDFTFMSSYFDFVQSWKNGCRTIFERRAVTVQVVKNSFKKLKLTWKYFKFSQHKILGGYCKTRLHLYFILCLPKTTPNYSALFKLCLITNCNCLLLHN